MVSAPEGCTPKIGVTAPERIGGAISLAGLAIFLATLLFGLARRGARTERFEPV